MSNDKLDNLSESDVWIFTKQSMDFDTAFKATKLLSEMPQNSSNNIEHYFKDNHKKYDISTDRHRVLIIAQLFGLLTKTPPYKKGGAYSQESPTEMFELLNKCEIGSPDYNQLKSEQILKVKVRAITDSDGNNLNWNILTVIFSYKVLRLLKEQHKINSVSLELFYTYVMTCSNYRELYDAVNYIKNASSPITIHFDRFKDRSRFTTLMEKNIKLFMITTGEISINEQFDDYFNDTLIENIDIDELNIQLSRDVDYTYFLTNHQGFNVNLIDNPGETEELECQAILMVPKIRKKKVFERLKCILEDDDFDYVEKVNDVKEYNINEKIVKESFNNEPSTTTSSILKRYSKNPLIGKVAIKRADYKCENDHSHKTFISPQTNRPYMEAHHLIPIFQQDIIWEKFNKNVDCVENIISLCPNCHRAIHYADIDVKRQLIEKLYNMRREDFLAIKLNVSLDYLMTIYTVIKK